MKPRFSFWLRLASNKHVDLRKIENIIRSKCYPKDISKDKRQLISENPCRNFKIVDGHLSYEGKKVILDNDRKLSMPQYFSILP